MKLIDRLIDKAHKIKFTYGNNVFIISNETGEWTVDGQAFPDLEAAQAYVEGLIPDGTPDSTLIINDVGPDDAEALKKLAVPAGWLNQLIRKTMEERQRKREKENLNRTPGKDRRLI